MSSYFNTDWNLIGDYSGMNNAPSPMGSDNSSKWQEAFLKASSWMGMDPNRRSRYNSYRDYDNAYNSRGGEDRLNQSNPYLTQLAGDTFLYTEPQQGKQFASSGGGRSGGGGVGGAASGAAQGLVAGLSTGIPHFGAIGAIAGGLKGLFG